MIITFFVKLYQTKFMQKKGEDVNMKQTDMESIRNLAIAFLYTDIHATKISFVASHPFINTWETYIPHKGLVDLREEKNVRVWRETVEKLLKKQDLVGIFFMMQPPYILNFLKFAERYMSDEDLGLILASFWSSIEQISLDNSVNGKTLVGWFKRADNEKLMSEKEIEKYDTLPEKIMVYRGVTEYNDKNKKALSWSLDKEVAIWFAKRFQTGKGKVWSVEVPKERILCVSDEKEKEVIVNLYGFDGKYQVEKV